MTKIQRLVKIKILKELLKEYELLAKYNSNGTDYDRYCALDMAIKELEQKPKTDVLNKIRSEIEQRFCRMANDTVTQECMKYVGVAILEIIDKYQEESEEA